MTVSGVSLLPFLGPVSCVVGKHLWICPSQIPSFAHYRSSPPTPGLGKPVSPGSSHLSPKFLASPSSICLFILPRLPPRFVTPIYPSHPGIVVRSITWSLPQSLFICRPRSPRSANVVPLWVWKGWVWRVGGISLWTLA